MYIEILRHIYLPTVYIKTFGSLMGGSSTRSGTVQSISGKKMGQLELLIFIII